MYGCHNKSCAYLLAPVYFMGFLLFKFMLQYRGFNTLCRLPVFNILTRTGWFYVGLCRFLFFFFNKRVITGIEGYLWCLNKCAWFYRVYLYRHLLVKVEWGNNIVLP